MGVIFILISENLFNLGTAGSPQEEQDASFKSVLFCNSFLAVGSLVLLTQNRELKRAKLESGKDSLLEEN